ncbi:hypothetical protein ACHAQH_006074 [Verticillium albo-atrum]
MYSILKSLPLIALAAAAADLDPEIGGYTSSGSPASGPPFGLPTERFEAVLSKPNTTTSVSYGNLGFNNSSDTWTVDLALAANVSLEGATQAGNDIGEDHVTQLTILSLKLSEGSKFNTDGIRVSVFRGIAANATGNETNISDCVFLSDECRRAIQNTATDDDMGPALGDVYLGPDNLDDSASFYAYGTRPTEAGGEESNGMYEYALTKIWAVVLRSTKAGAINGSSMSITGLRCLRAGTIEEESGESGGNDNGEGEPDSGDGNEDDGSAASVIRARLSAGIVAFTAAMVMA